MTKLGPLQEKILRHFFQCSEKKKESVQHLSRSIGAIQSSVSRSVKHMIHEKYVAVDRNKNQILKREAGSLFFEKALYVTDKGILYAIVGLGLNYDDAIDYYEKYGHPSASHIRQILDENFPDKEKREYRIRKNFEFILKNNLFDEEGNVRVQLTREEASKLRLHLQRTAFEYLESVVLNNPGVSSFHDIVDKAKIDREFTKKSLIQRKEGLERALRELG